MAVLQVVDEVLDFGEQVRRFLRLGSHSGLHPRPMPRRHRLNGQLVERLGISRQPPDPRARRLDCGAYGRAELGPECVIDGLDLHDGNCQRQHVKVSRDDDRILEGDHTGDGLDDCLLHLRIGRQ